MIIRIDLECFKCFNLLKLPLCSLNLLTGTNASGKSTVLQALVLLSQSMRENEWSNKLALNGNLVQLGTVSDVVNSIDGRSSFGITLWDDSDARINWEFKGDPKAMSMDVERIRIEYKDENIFDSTQPFSSDSFFRLLPGSKFDSDHSNTIIDIFSRPLSKLTYLTAERLGPRDTYLYKDILSDDIGVGPKGENTASVLYAKQDKPVEAKLVRNDAASTSLLTQVKAHMNRFFPDFDLTNDPIFYTNMLNLRILTSNKSNFQRPVHTGFGVTQLLPIVVAALSAEKGDVIIVENPENHLHPAGQAMIGEFLTEVASAGIQVFVKTHSDHVFNGVRRGVKKQILPPNEVSLNFFQRQPNDDEEALPQVQIIAMDNDGRLDAWPENFFDQIEKDLAYIAGWQ